MLRDDIREEPGLVLRLLATWHCGARLAPVCFHCDRQGTANLRLGRGVQEAYRAAGLPADPTGFSASVFRFLTPSGPHGCARAVLAAPVSIALMTNTLCHKEASYHGAQSGAAIGPHRPRGGKGTGQKTNSK